MAHRSVNTAQQGFTLIELVMVIVIMGIIGGVLSIFMKSPIDAYLATARRAGLSDAADTMLRRFARDVHGALPNSLRSTGSACIEFIPVKTGGRFRADGSATALTPGVPTSSFNMLGSNAAKPASQRMVAGDLVVVYNQGIAGANAYALDNVSAITSIGIEAGAETPINIVTKTFPAAASTNRFQVIDALQQQVAYVCDSASRSMYRTASATLTALPQCSISGGARIAGNVDCSNTAFTYSGSDLQRNAVVSLILQLSDSGEVVQLQQEIHINNTP